MAKPAATLAVTLPLPPGVNNQYLTAGNRRVLSQPARAFKRDVAKLIARLRADGDLPAETGAIFRGAFLGIYLTFYFETPNRRDLDGGLKITLDALCAALDLDDRTVVDLHLTKRIDPLRPRLEVEMEAIHDWQFDRTYVYLGESAEVSRADGDE